MSLQVRKHGNKLEPPSSGRAGPHCSAKMKLQQNVLFMKGRIFFYLRQQQQEQQGITNFYFRQQQQQQQGITKLYLQVGEGYPGWQVCNPIIPHAKW